MYRLSDQISQRCGADFFNAHRIYVRKHRRLPEWQVIIPDPHGLSAPWTIPHPTHREALAFATRYADRTKHHYLPVNLSGL